MAYYYYLVAQLPCLVYGQALPMLPEAFIGLAKPQLNNHDAALLDMVSLDPPPPPSVSGEPSVSASLAHKEKVPASGSGFIDGWREWEWTLRLNLAKERAHKNKREGGVMANPPVIPTDAAVLAHKVITTIESPLEAEMMLDRARWDIIIELQGNDFFDRNTVFAYLLKLFILQRHSLFQTEAGFSEYKSLYTSILEKAESGGRI